MNCMHTLDKFSSHMQRDEGIEELLPCRTTSYFEETFSTSKLCLRPYIFAVTSITCAAESTTSKFTLVKFCSWLTAAYPRAIERLLGRTTVELVQCEASDTERNSKSVSPSELRDRKETTHRPFDEHETRRLTQHRRRCVIRAFVHLQQQHQQHQQQQSNGARMFRDATVNVTSVSWRLKSDAAPVTSSSSAAA
jgi:hypothetical protein